MAQIVATYDTVTKAFSLTIDGQAVPDLDCVEFRKPPMSYEDVTSPDEPEAFRCYLSTVSEDPIHKVRVFSHMVASEKGLTSDSGKLTRDIVSYLGRK